MNRLAWIAIPVLTFALAGCTAAPDLLAVTTAPPPETSSTPTVEAAEPGTRSNPLAVGESRRISPDSMWIVGANAATEVHDGYVVLPITLTFDWEAASRNADAEGFDVNETGIDPWSSLNVEFVTAEGRSFSTFDDYTVDIPNDLYKIGTVYPPVESVSAAVPISVPSEDVNGGVWAVRNYVGDGVFLSTGE